MRRPWRYPGNSTGSRRLSRSLAGRAEDRQTRDLHGCRPASACHRLPARAATANGRLSYRRDSPLRTASGMSPDAGCNCHVTMRITVRMLEAYRPSNPCAHQAASLGVLQRHGLEATYRKMCKGYYPLQSCQGRVPPPVEPPAQRLAVVSPVRGAFLLPQHPHDRGDFALPWPPSNRAELPRSPCTPIEPGLSRPSTHDQPCADWMREKLWASSSASSRMIA